MITSWLPRASGTRRSRVGDLGSEVCNSCIRSELSTGPGGPTARGEREGGTY